MKNYIITLFLAVATLSCQQGKNPSPKHHHAGAAYNTVDIIPTSDTIRFLLDEESFSDLESWSVREISGKTYITFFDQVSESINIYSYPDNSHINKIELQRFFKPTTVNSAYFHNYDSIFLTTREALYMIDSSGKNVKKFTFDRESRQGRGRISPENPLYLQHNTAFLAVSPSIDNSSKSSIRSWKMLWTVNLENNKTSRYYHLPEIYTENYYVGKLIKYSYCMNDAGRFVVSFAADTMLYETDLKDYHHSYFAKSQYQLQPIKYSSRDKLREIKEEAKVYMTSDSYGSVYYDPYHHRYLRVAKPPISEDDFDAKRYQRPYRLIIFDKHFKIIGESDFEEGIDLRRMFFTPDGKIYAEVTSPTDYQFNFLRLEYKTNQVTDK